MGAAEPQFAQLTGDCIQHDMVISHSDASSPGSGRFLGRQMGPRGNSIHSMSKIVSRLLLVLLIVTLIYAALGVGFHVRWKSELAECREAQMASGEFVEPEVFGGALGLAFDVAFWPVYTWANIYHDGTPFATPCTH